MRRVMALWLPFWPAERKRRTVEGGQANADAVRLVVAVERGVRRIDATCPKGDACGIRPGMPLVEARARIASGSVLEFDRDPAADRRAMGFLARWLLGFVPAVATAPGVGDGDVPSPGIGPREHGLFADLTGCGRWLAWQAAFARTRSPPSDLEAELARLRKIHQALSARGISVRLGVAGTPGAAWAIARFGTDRVACRVLPPGEERAALAPLPIECLRLGPGQAEILREVEVRTVADLLALDRDEIADRFRPEGGRSGTPPSPDRLPVPDGILHDRPNEGSDAARIPRRSSPRFCGGRAPARLVRALAEDDRPEGSRREGVPAVPSPAHRLDQAFGFIDETLTPMAVAPSMLVERDFAGPVADLETIAIAFAGLVERLCRRLRRSDRGVRTLRLRWIPVRGEPWIVPLELGHPTRRPGHLWTIVRPIIESMVAPAPRRGPGRRTRDVDGGFDSIAIEAVHLVRTPAAGPDRDLEGLDLPSRRPHDAVRSSRRTRRDDPVEFLPAAECIDRLVARFGAAGFAVAGFESGHRPEGEGRFTAWRAGKAREPHDDSPAVGFGPPPTWRPPVPEPLAFVADDVVRWRSADHRLRLVGPAEVFLDRWWSATPAAEGVRERVARYLELGDGLGLRIVRDRDPGERLAAPDAVARDRLDAAMSPACRAASWRVIGIGA